METCENCGKKIGNLETPKVFQDHIVCGECWEKLSPREIDYESAVPAAPVKMAGAAAGVTDLTQKYARYATRSGPVAGPACPACGYRGEMKRTPKGSTIVLILLLLLWVIPGLIYLFVYQGHKYVCPQCGCKIADA